MLANTTRCTIPLQLLPVKPPHLAHLSNPSIPIFLAPSPYPLPQHIAQHILPFDLLEIAKTDNQPPALIQRTPLNPPTVLPFPADSAPSLSLPIHQKATHLLQPITPLNLSHACLIRAHSLLANPHSPPTPLPTLAPDTLQCLPTNQWITIDGPTTIDRDDAIMLTVPNESLNGSPKGLSSGTTTPQLHIAIPIPAPYNPSVSSSIYLPDSSAHLLPLAQLEKYSLDTGPTQKLVLVLTLNFNPDKAHPFQFHRWSTQHISIAHNLQFDSTDRLLQNPPSNQNPLWATLCSLLPPNPLTPLKQLQPSQHLIEILMVLTNTLASASLQYSKNSLFWKATPPQSSSSLEELLTNCTPQTLPPTHYSSSKPTHPWPFTPQAWLNLLSPSPAVRMAPTYLQITSPLRRWTDLVNLHALCHSLPKNQGTPALPSPPIVRPFYSDTLLNAIQKHIRQTQNFATFQHSLLSYFSHTQSPIPVKITPFPSNNPAHSAYRATITPLDTKLSSLTLFIPHKLLPIPATPTGSTGVVGGFSTTLQWNPAIAPPSAQALAAFQSCPFLFHTS